MHMPSSFGESSGGPDQQDTPDAPSLFDDGGDRTAAWFAGNRQDMTGQDAGHNIPAEIGDYSLLAKIGSGGMGSVFRARHRRSGEIVAVKVLKRGIFASQNSVQRFEKESHIHARIDSPYVVRHLAFHQDRGMQFIVSEYVDGVNLHSVCRHLDQESALLITRDILRALDAIHQQGIVHRDVKPGNVMLVCKRPPQAGSFAAADFELAKLMDFGIAREIDQSASMAMTRTEMTLGTPLYMAPEQHQESRDVTPAADVYAVGATLYHMLSGEPPFQSEDRNSLAELHRSEYPVGLAGSHGDAIDGVVMKALEKLPQLRFADAGAMLHEIEQIIAGKPASLSTIENRIDAGTRKQKRYRFQWELDATAEALWPLVSDTDRFNRAMKLPPPEFSFEGTGSDRRLFASANFNGMGVRWLEHPFEWIVGRRMSVLREFEKGPFASVTSSVELQPLRENRTRLVHEFHVRSRGVFGWMLTPLQFGVLTPRQLTRVYRRIETIARQADRPLACDVPFGKLPQLSPVQQLRLEKAAEDLSASTREQELADRLIRYLEVSSDAAVARIRPGELAAKNQCEVDRVLKLCLQAVDAGALNLMWDVICPVCRIASETRDHLSQIEAHARCEVCNLEFATDFSQSVELVFCVHSEIREVDNRTWCAGGPFHSPHVLMQGRVPPADNFQFGVRLQAGEYHVRSPQLDRVVPLAATDSDAEPKVELQIPALDSESGQAPTGLVAVNLLNAADRVLLTRLERISQRSDAVTAAQACQLPLFRQLFSDQVPSADRLVSVSSRLLVACRLDDFETLVARIGEASADRSVVELIDSLTAGESEVEVIHRGSDRFSIAIGSHSEAVTATRSILEHCQNSSIACSIAIGSGTLQQTGSGANRQIYGKAVRELDAQLSSLQPNRLLIKLTLANSAEFTAWIEADLEQIRTSTGSKEGWKMYRVRT